MRFIDVSKMWDEIYSDESDISTDKESRYRLYRGKFTTMLQLFCCGKENYKTGKNKYVVFEQDFYVVKYIITEAVKEKTAMAKWFNGHMEELSRLDVVDLYENFECALKRFLAEEKLDAVRMNEWLGAMNTILDYSTAKKITEIEHLLEEFGINTLPLTNHIPVGQIISGDENGNSWVAMPAKDANEIICKDTKTKINKKEYLEDIYNKLQTHNVKAKEQSYDLIKKLTQSKIHFGAKGTADDYLDHESKEIASTYVLRDYNIQRYLIQRPEIKKQLEEEMEVDDVLKLYKIAANAM